MSPLKEFILVKIYLNNLINDIIFYLLNHSFSKFTNICLVPALLSFVRDTCTKELFFFFNFHLFLIHMHWHPLGLELWTVLTCHVGSGN